MYNILIVDDEPMICKGISKIIRQSELPVEHVFTAGTGFEALDYIRLDKVDLLITDIQMEQMNGIELMETVFVENPSLPVVVLSAHGQFEYAQKAMRFGAKEYIIKPVVPGHLLKIVAALLKEREQQVRTLSETELSRKFNLEQMTVNENLMLHETISEGVEPSELEQILTHLDKHLSGNQFSVMVIRLNWRKAGLSDQEITSLRDRNLLKYACRNVVEETLDKGNDIVFYSPNGTLTVLLQLSERDADDSRNYRSLTMIAQKIYGNLSAYVHMESFVGVSRIGEGVQSWPELYKEAVNALGWSEVHEDHHVFHIDDFGKYKGRTAASDDISHANQPIVQDDNNAFIADTKAYVESHYRQKGMKLQDIANAVHLSPNYLSYLFKKVAGTGIWDYVTHIRMEEGKRLLLTTDMRRYEIADEIGYESPEHFSKIFKKHFGYNLSDAKKT
jgi:two-component system response regulator YesN